MSLQFFGVSFLFSRPQTWVHRTPVSDTTDIRSTGNTIHWNRSEICLKTSIELTSLSDCDDGRLFWFNIQKPKIVFRPFDCISRNSYNKVYSFCCILIGVCIQLIITGRDKYSRHTDITALPCKEVYDQCSLLLIL